MILYFMLSEGETNSCPDGMVYMDCGSACNVTCDDQDRNFIVPCTLQCVPRCQCPAETVQDTTYDGVVRYGICAKVSWSF